MSNKRKKQNWGGKRTGAGRKPEWNLGSTELVRLPKAIAQQIIVLSREIDVNALSEKDAIALIEKLILIVQEESDF